MKIAFFLNEFPVLSQTFVLNQIESIARSGHEVHVYAKRRSKDRSDALSASLNPEVKVIYLYAHSRQTHKRVISVFSRLLSELSLKKIMHTFNFVSAREWLLGMEHISAVHGNGRYDVVHCQFATLWSVVGPLLSTGVISGKLLVSVRGYDITVSENYEKWSYQKLFEKADLLLPVSKSLGKHLKNLGCDDDKIRVLHSGVEIESFVPKSFAPIRQPVKLVSVGRLVEKKGFKFAIQAIRLLVEQGLRCEYTLIGDGPLKKDLEAYVLENGLAESVFLKGACDHDTVKQTMSSADIYLAPCITAKSGDQEGIPNVLKEAMLLEVPVIATRHSGIPELVSDKVSGFLADEKDVVGIVECVNKLLGMSNPDRLAMVQAARKHVEENFDTKKISVQLEALYREVCA